MCNCFFVSVEFSIIKDMIISSMQLSYLYDYVMYALSGSFNL